MFRTPLVLLALCVAAGCATAPRERSPLASAQIVPDFGTYSIRRVGLVPFTGSDVTGSQSAELQGAFFSEISASTSYEIVALQPEDLAEIPSSDPYRRGWYRPQTIIEVSRRYQLDALLIGTVADSQYFPPQRLSVQLDMVASETGLPVWSSSVHLDASRAAVRDSLEAWSETRLGGEAAEWEVTLISPRRFAHFAAFQMAQML